MTPNIIARYDLPDHPAHGRVAADLLSAGDIFVPRSVVLELAWLLGYVADRPQDKVLHRPGLLNVAARR